mmetsp:Transcript_57443/g.133896  ORF Transcript_57443/g.133896 Transcript_57443/m.133896 type:complete len:207 (+) Transcript_57443:101-721(+)
MSEGCAWPVHNMRHELMSLSFLCSTIILGSRTISCGETPHMTACLSKASFEHSLPSHSASKMGGCCQPSDETLGLLEAAPLHARLTSFRASICCSSSLRSNCSDSWPPSSASSSATPAGAEVLPWPMAMRVVAISAKMVCNASPSCIGNGPNFHASPCTRSKSASAPTQASSSSSWPDPSLLSLHRITALTGLNLGCVCSRVRSTV